MSELGFAIIGPGKVGHIHARILAALPGARLAAVCGRNAERTAAFAAQYAAQPYTDLSELLADPAVDAAIICTPHPQHAAQAVAALRARRGVVSQRRWYEPVRRVKDAIDAGKIGRPILGTVTVLGWRGPEYYAMDPWRGKWDAEGGGVLVNQTSHQLDLFQWFMGPVEEVCGYWGNLTHPYIEVEDTAVAALRFRNGALGSLVVSNCQNPGIYGNIHVHGSNGATVGVQTDGGSMFFVGQAAAVEPPINDLWTVAGELELLPGWQAEDRARIATLDIMSDYTRRQVADFVAAIVEDRPPAVTGEDGRQAVALFDAVYRSGRERGPVQVE
ncbi:MAG: 1,5-anhydro-D-fructose reductase [Chloroflexi bacterium ADurb.Bin325]|nr:MAG: 1,5-anhydro-D-fructose reductase [Chloroflexi bacterium ADurb.Bin325]